MNVALIRLSDAAPGSALYTGLPYTGRRDEHVSVRVNPDFRAVYEFGAKKCSSTTIGREIWLNDSRIYVPVLLTLLALALMTSSRARMKQASGRQCLIPWQK